MKLSALLSDGMVLQREKHCPVWGAECVGPVTVRVLGGEKILAEAVQEEQPDGTFEILLPVLPAGGPYEILISDRAETRRIRDVLVGDVFLLAGQSNMELPVRRTLDETEAFCKTIDEPDIRQFEVPKEHDFKGPVSDVYAGTWKKAVQEHLYDFSALGLFFAMLWKEEKKVPVGLLQTACGGIQIEALIPEEKLIEEVRRLREEAEKRGESKERNGVLTGSHYDKFCCEDVIRLDKDDAFISKTLEEEERKNNAFYEWLDRTDAGLKYSWKDRKSLYAPGENVQYIEVPGRWECLPGKEYLETLRGSVWVLKRFEVPDECIGKEAKLYLGTVVDADETYINGILTGRTEYRYPPRRYVVKPGVLKKTNTLVVRVKALQRPGGFVEEMPYFLKCGEVRVSLNGKYEFRTGTDLYPGGRKAFPEIEEPENTFFHYRPCGVYNKMIYPLRKMRLQGMLFYQGESNTLFYREYEALLRLMISSVRETFCEPSLKTGVVVLPFFGEEDDERGSGNWEKLREAQKRAGDIENCVLIDLYDLGQRYELHPQNKREAAARVFRAVVLL